MILDRGPDSALSSDPQSNNSSWTNTSRFGVCFEPISRARNCLGFIIMSMFILVWGEEENF